MHFPEVPQQLQFQLFLRWPLNHPDALCSFLVVDRDMHCNGTTIDPCSETDWQDPIADHFLYEVNRFVFVRRFCLPPVSDQSKGTRVHIPPKTKQLFLGKGLKLSKEDSGHIEFDLGVDDLLTTNIAIQQRSTLEARGQPFLTIVREVNDP